MARWLKLGLFYRVMVHDKEGKVVYDSGERPSKSFVLQFLQFIECHMAARAVSMRDITNVLRSNSSHAVNFRASAAAGETNYGQVVGTGTTPPTNNDYRLASLIAHGAGAGQLLYQAQAIGGAAVVGANVDLVCSRQFTNNSGATITVNEIGIYMMAGSGTWYHLMARDVLPTGVDVPNLETLTVQYTLRTTV